MAKIKVNSVVKLYTLCLLNNGPKHGYEIIKELENRMSRTISASHVYPFLKSLQANDVIACKEVEKRERKKYSLTKNGEEFVKVVFDKLEGLMSTVIDKRISSCKHCDCKVYGGSYSELIDNEKTNFCCVHCASAFKKNLILAQ